MAFEIPDHFHSSFTTNVELLNQQNQPILAPHVSTGAYSGESAQVIKQYGEVEFQQKASQFADTTFETIEHRQRWVFPEDFTLALPVDKEDELKQLDSPISPYAQAMNAAWGRRVDETIYNAMVGTSQTGKNGSTATTFANEVDQDGNANDRTIAVDEGASAATGLNVEKLILAKEELINAEVNIEAEMPCIAISDKQLSDLLRSIEITSADYNDVRALVHGEVNTFMGFYFKIYQRMTGNANSLSSGDRICPVWVPSGVHLGQWSLWDAGSWQRPVQ